MSSGNYRRLVFLMTEVVRKTSRLRPKGRDQDDRISNKIHDTSFVWFLVMFDSQDIATAAT